MSDKEATDAPKAEKNGDIVKLKKQLDSQSAYIRKLVKRLEELIGFDLDGDGTVGKSLLVLAVLFGMATSSLAGFETNTLWDLISPSTTKGTCKIIQYYNTNTLYVDGLVVGRTTTMSNNMTLVGPLNALNITTSALTGCTISNATIKGPLNALNVTTSALTGCTLTNATIVGGTMSGTYNGLNITTSSLYGCTLTNATVVNPTISGPLNALNVTTSALTGCTITNPTIVNATVSGPLNGLNITTSALTGCTLTNATIAGPLAVANDSAFSGTLTSTGNLYSKTGAFFGTIGRPPVMWTNLVGTPLLVQMGSTTCSGTAETVTQAFGTAYSATPLFFNWRYTSGAMAPTAIVTLATNQFIMMAETSLMWQVWGVPALP